MALSAVVGLGLLGLGAAPALADMLSGGLLGSVFRGDEFTGPRLLDLVVIGLLIFLLLRLVLGRTKSRDAQTPQRFEPPDTGASAPPPPSAPSPMSRPAEPRPKRDMYTNAQAAWDALKSRPSANDAPGAGRPASPVGGAPAASTPDEEFLAGAKMAYGRILGAVTQRDFADLEHFLTPDFLARLKESLPLSPPPLPDILLVEATLADRREEPGRTVMVVEYDVLVHEKDAPHNTDRRERWRFVRDNATTGANWLLDAMDGR